ncbi:MAG: hypothetical protein U1E52_10235 [Geminicoccaceae bacterium]
MSTRLLCGVSGLALACAAFAAPASAQLADVSIEGPIQSVTPFAAPVGDTIGTRAVNVVGEMRVMGVLVKVLDTTPVHTPTNEHVTLGELADGPLPGRSGPGFIDGTAIVTGDSLAGVLYATDVFTDFAEHVIVGEATGIAEDDELVTRATVNKTIIQALTDPRMPAGPPINSFGFSIDPTNIAEGSLVAAEGYYANNRLYYHNLEADAGALINPSVAEVSVLRAQCRIRGRNRDELEVRGGTHTPANGRVTIQRLVPNPNPLLAGTWQNVAPINIAPVVDTTVTPQQGLYRYNAANLNLGAVCPAQIRAIMRATANGPILATSDPFTPDSR